jgi:hypothetical protein
MDGNHVDDGSGPVWISRVNGVEVGDIATFGVVDEEMMDCVLIHRSNIV